MISLETSLILFLRSLINFSKSVYALGYFLGELQAIPRFLSTYLSTHLSLFE